MVAHLDGKVELVPRYDRVILLFLDGFGWRFFEKFCLDHRFLQRFQTDGTAVRWTSQFPSTTTAHVTTMHTGLPVGQSGLYEWIYYEPEVDALIAPLLFSFAGTSTRDTLASTGIDSALLYPTQTLYQALQKSGISSYLFQDRAYTPSTYSNAVFRGAEVVPYYTLAEAVSNLHILLAQAREPSYFFLYFDKIDVLCHAYGPSSPQVAAEIDHVMLLLERLLIDPIWRENSSEKTLLIVTADHGQIEVDPQTVVYLNVDPALTAVEQSFRRTGSGTPIVPAGCPRDMFLYVRDDALRDVQHFLARGLSGVADVVATEQLLKHGYFGIPPFSRKFLDRLGNLVILPHAGESVWWYEKDKYSMSQYGHHGGLTPQEAEIPLLLLEVS